MGIKVKLPFIAAGITVFFWSSAFPAVKYCLDYYSPEAIMLLRFIVAAIVLLGFCAVKRIPAPRKKDLPMFIAAGFIGLFLYMWAFNTGTGMVPSGVSGFIIASAPVFSLIFSILFLKEKAGLSTWLGVLISFVGIAVVASTQVTEMRLNIGVWLLLGAAICTSLFNVIQKKILKSYTAIQSITWSVAFAALFMCVFLPKLINELPSAPLAASGVIVYLGVFPAAIAYFLWGYALSKTEKTIQVTSFLYLSPFLASIMAFLWLREEMPVLGILGGVIIIAGMIITSRKRRT